jgi:hypothetical protein
VTARSTTMLVDSIKASEPRIATSVSEMTYSKGSVVVRDE